MHEVTTKPLSLARLKTLILEDSKLKLSIEVTRKIQECRAYLDQKIATTSCWIITRGKLSPQQVKNLLEAMNNEEKKVQEKMNASKTKGVKVKTEKDW